MVNRCGQCNYNSSKSEVISEFLLLHGKDAMQTGSIFTNWIHDYINASREGMLHAKLATSL